MNSIKNLRFDKEGYCYDLVFYLPFYKRNKKYGGRRFFLSQCNRERCRDTGHQYPSYQKLFKLYYMAYVYLQIHVLLLQSVTKETRCLRCWEDLKFHSRREKLLTATIITCFLLLNPITLNLPRGSHLMNKIIQCQTE